MKKRIFALLLAVTTVISCCGFASASSVETTRDVSSENVNEEITPFGVLSGYGARWNDEGSLGAYFEVNVKGLPWSTAQTTFTIENFPLETVVKISLGKDGHVLYTDALTMGYRETVTNAKFAPGDIGRYDVAYEILDWVGKEGGLPPPAGRVLCWIY